VITGADIILSAAFTANIPAAILERKSLS
jgi:hypothetical protein